MIYSFCFVNILFWYLLSHDECVNNLSAFKAYKMATQIYKIYISDFTRQTNKTTESEIKYVLHTNCCQKSQFRRMHGYVHTHVRIHDFKGYIVQHTYFKLLVWISIWISWLLFDSDPIFIIDLLAYSIVLGKANTLIVITIS